MWVVLELFLHASTSSGTAHPWMGDGQKCRCSWKYECKNQLQQNMRLPFRHELRESGSFPGLELAEGSDTVRLLHQHPVRSSVEIPRDFPLIFPSDL